MSEGIASVLKVISEFEVVINKGENDGIKHGQRFLLYYLDDEELIDPDTKESLGFLEIIVGKGEATHVQDKISTLTSYMTETTDERTITRRKNNSIAAALYGNNTEEETITPTTKRIPFKNPSTKCKAKQI